MEVSRDCLLHKQIALQQSDALHQLGRRKDQLAWFDTCPNW